MQEHGCEHKYVQNESRNGRRGRESWTEGGETGYLRGTELVSAMASVLSPVYVLPRRVLLLLLLLRRRRPAMDLASSSSVLCVDVARRRLSPNCRQYPSVFLLTLKMPLLQMWVCMYVCLDLSIYR
jgi:hypothetical protein